MRKTHKSRYWNWLLNFLKPHLCLFIFLLCLIAISTLLSLCSPYLLKVFMDQVLPSRKVILLLRVILAMLTAFILGNIVSSLHSYLFIRMSQQILFAIRLNLFKHIQNLPLGFFIKRKSGEITARLYTDTQQISDTLTDAAPNFVVSIFEFLGAMGFIWWLNHRLLTAIAIIIPFYAIAMKYFRPKIIKVSREVREDDNALFNLMTETFAGIKTTKSFTAESLHEEKFITKSKRYITTLLRSRLVFIFAGGTTSLIDQIVWLGMMAYSAILVFRGDMTVGGMIAFCTLIYRVLGPMRSFAGQYLNLLRVRAPLDRIFEFLDIEPEDKDHPDAVPVERIEGDIRINNLSFAYNTEKKVFEGIDLSIPQGKLTVITGPSGVGKTTLVNLVCRFYEPQSGNIAINDRDIRKITLASWRKQISIVDQDSFLFNTTLRENISYGKPNASLEEIVDACKKAYIHQLIETLSNGYETIVGERGLSLSGGERQRIAIARAILRNSKILILDEPTAFLDTASEDIIKKTFDSLVKNGITVIIVTHRLSVIANADKMITLDKGKVREKVLKD